MIGPRRRAAIAFFLVNLGAVACGLRQTLGLKQAMNSLTERSARSAERVLVMPRGQFADSTQALLPREKTPQAPRANASEDALGRIARHTTDILTKNGASCPCAAAAVVAAATPPSMMPRPVKKEAPAAAYLTTGRPRPTTP